VLINKASGAVRCRHPPHARPGGGALPDAFGAARLLYEKTAGRSCRRRARTTLTARPAPPPATSPPRTRRLRPTGRLPFSTDPRPRRARPRTGLRPWVARHDRRRSARQGPQAHRKAGLMRTAWPPISITRDARAGARRTQRSTPDSPPWEGPQPPADSQPRRHPAKRGRIGTRPDALAYWWNSDPNPSSQQPASGPRLADSCAWIPERRTIHRPLIHGIVHKHCRVGQPR